MQIPQIMGTFSLVLEEAAAPSAFSFAWLATDSWTQIYLWVLRLSRKNASREIPEALLSSAPTGKVPREESRKLWRKSFMNGGRRMGQKGNTNYLGAVGLPVARWHLDEWTQETQKIAIGCILVWASVRPAGQQVVTLSCQEERGQHSRRQQAWSIFYQSLPHLQAGEHGDTWRWNRDKALSQAYLRPGKCCQRPTHLQLSPYQHPPFWKYLHSCIETGLSCRYLHLEPSLQPPFRKYLKLKRWKVKDTLEHVCRLWRPRQKMKCQCSFFGQVFTMCTDTT